MSMAVKQMLSVGSVSNTGIDPIIERQVNLMRYALEAESDASMFESIESIIQCPVAVISAAGQLLYNGSEIERKLLLEQWPWPAGKLWVRRNGWQALRAPLVQKKVLLGYVYYVSDLAYPSPLEEALYIQASQLIAHQLSFLYSDYLHHSVQRDISYVIRQYIRQEASLQAVISLTEQWNVNWLKESYRCVLTAMHPATEHNYESLASAELKQYLRRHPTIQNLNGIHVVLNGTILSIIPESEKATLQQRYEQYAEAIRGLECGVARIIIGSCKSGLHYLLEGYEECKHTMEVCTEWNVKNRVVAQEYADFSLLLENVPRSQMKKYYRYRLGEMLPGGKHYTEELYETLITYLDCNGHMNETAGRLFVHRNTAAYRIEKLGELMNVDLKQLDEIIRLKLALQLYRMVEQQRIAMY